MLTPILILGAGRMGGAMIEGWLTAGAFAAADIFLCDPHPGKTALAAAERGASLNPPASTWSIARTVVLAVKPQLWREAAAEYAPHLAPDAAVVSIAAGVRTISLSEAFGRAVARVMPTTAVSVLKGVATVFAETDEARGAARALFGPLGQVVDVDDEALIDAATAVSGSAPAYFYAFVEALEAAGRAVGLSAPDAAVLARQTLIGAAALMADSGEDPGELRRQVTSKAGTTEAALSVLLGEPGLEGLLKATVAAALARSRELAGP